MFLGELGPQPWGLLLFRGPVDCGRRAARCVAEAPALRSGKGLFPAVLLVGPAMDAIDLFVFSRDTLDL